MLTISLMKGYDARAEYEEARFFATSFILKIASTKKLTGDEIENAFAVNKSLRRLFDTYGRPDRGAFDSVYRPFGGWKYYFERNSNDLGELQEYDKIQREIEDNMG